jgi:flagellar hook-length control protein FliK
MLDTFDKSETIPFVDFVQQPVVSSAIELAEHVGTPKGLEPVKYEHSGDEIEILSMVPDDSGSEPDNDKTASVDDIHPLNEDSRTLQNIVAPNQVTEQHNFVAARSPIELDLLTQQTPARETLARAGNPVMDTVIIARHEHSNINKAATDLGVDFGHLQTKNDQGGELKASVKDDRTSQLFPQHRPSYTSHSMVEKPFETINPVTFNGSEKPKHSSPQTEYPYLVPRAEAAQQQPPTEITKLAQNTPQAAQLATSTYTTDLVSKTRMDHSIDVSDLRAEPLLEARPTTHLHHSQTVSKGDFSAPVTRQIVDAVHARITAEKIIEVSLNPAELGRLKLILTPAENGLIINVMAERAETIEIIRRNMIDLEKAFSEMGHENISFSFDQNSEFAGQNEQDNEQGSAGQHPEKTDWPEQVKPATTSKMRLTVDPSITTGIDIRV